MKLVGAKHLCKISLLSAVNLSHKCFARTGQGKFIVVLVDLDTHKLVGLVSERTQGAIKEVMLQWGEKVGSSVLSVLSLPKFIIKALRYKALTLLAGLFCPMTTGDTGVSAFKSQPAMVLHTIEVIIWHTFVRKNLFL
jgi:hypothetical protein